MDPIVIAIVIVGLFVIVVGLYGAWRAFREREGHDRSRR